MKPLEVEKNTQKGRIEVEGSGAPYEVRQDGQKQRLKRGTLT